MEFFTGLVSLNAVYIRNNNKPSITIKVKAKCSQLSRTGVAVLLTQLACSSDIQHVDRYTTKEVAACFKHNLQPPCIHTRAVYWKYLKNTKICECTKTAGLIINN